MIDELRLFILLIAVNGGPIIARVLLPRARFPIDGGMTAWDGRPLLGKSKTWRGLGGGMLVGSGTGWLLGYSWFESALFSALSLTGDLITSFIKRRLGLTASAEAPILDQFLEVALPLAAAYALHEVDPTGLVMVLLAFILFNWGISPLLYRLGLRKRPY